MKKPKVGEVYNCFDDGKIKESRKYKVTIAEIVPFDEIDSVNLEQWKQEVKACHWLYAKETDFFILADSEEKGQEGQEVFVRTVEGGWFSIGDWLSSGRLDVDGSLWQSHLDAVEKYR